jgi:RNA polymerase sigma-70 factor (ECF subfamily)
MSEPHVEAALEQVKHGVVDEYAVVVEAYQRRLRAWLASVCPPGIEPDEIAHRAFIEAYKQIDRYQSGSSFFNWLSAFARNLLLAELKRLQRQQKNTANYLQQVVLSGCADTAAEPVEAQEERLAALRACAELLSEDSRALLRERYTHNTPLDAVARQLGKTVAAIKFQLFAIRRKLRECVLKKLELQRLAAAPLGRLEAN